MTRILAAFACGAAALLLSASAASPAIGRSARASFTVAVLPVLTPAVVGSLYPPKPYPLVSFCRPVLKFGRACGDYAFKLKAKSGSLPAGMSVDPQSGLLIGLPRANSDLTQPAGSTVPGLYKFTVCAVSASLHKSVCKPTQLAVFSSIGGSWSGTYQGDPGAFSCNIPLAGDLKLLLKQSVTVVKGVAKSTVTGTATLANLPPISPDGTQNGPCTFATQTFDLLAGNVANPGAGGSNSAKGVWNVQVAANGGMSGSLTIQDTGSNGFFSQISFTASHS